MSDETKVQFSFGWLALKLLGKSLYSNAWSAISELVANGFDANANEVFIFLDVTNKHSATIEVFDNGDGMSLEEIDIYAQVGYNKREDYRRNNPDAPLPQNIMGRKGIGKLAALYLSSHYYLITKKENNPSFCWEMKYHENAEDTNEKPSLELLHTPPAIACSAQWSTFSHGTMLKMVDVNLSGLGDQAFLALNAKLANYFSLDSMDGRRIFLCIKSQSNNEIVFEPVEKMIAFKNMAFIEYSADNLPEQNTPINSLHGTKQKIPFTKLEEYYENAISVSEIKNSYSDGKQYTGTSKDGTRITKPYSLRGWIGIHCTIDPAAGKQNDEVFKKNKFYNPIQLRLYVRNKLAVENFLNIINSTQTYINYIEGEINFDLLDDDDFPDIATSNRQGLDEHDERVALLVNILNPIIRSLIDKRSQLAKKMKDVQQDIINDRSATAKEQFTNEVSTELDRYQQLTKDDKIELKTVISNKIQGEVHPKENRLIFFSHSRVDKIFADFIYNFLLEQGVNKEEIFYTSRDDNPEKYADITPLRDIIHKCITNMNNMIFYLVGPKYKESEYCMFEGGAGWATRSVGDYPLLAIKYDYIPKFLTNGKNEISIYNDKEKSISLDRNTYEAVVGIINRMIEHINGGRRIKSQEEVPLIPETSLPKEIEVFRSKEPLEKYMNPKIKEHWSCFVESQLSEYLPNVRS